MAVDIKVELFALDVFRNFWHNYGITEAVLPRAIGYQSDETSVGTEYIEGFCKALQFRHFMTLEVTRPKFRIDLPMFTKSKSDFHSYFCHFCSDFNFFESNSDYDYYMIEENSKTRLFRKILTTAAFLAEMSVQCALEENDIYIYTAPVTWAMYFDTELKIEFYENGGWEWCRNGVEITLYSYHNMVNWWFNKNPHVLNEISEEYNALVEHIAQGKENSSHELREKYLQSAKFHTLQLFKHPLQRNSHSKLEILEKVSSLFSILGTTFYFGEFSQSPDSVTFACDFEKDCITNEQLVVKNSYSVEKDSNESEVFCAANANWKRRNSQTISQTCESRAFEKPQARLHLSESLENHFGCWIENSTSVVREVSSANKKSRKKTNKYRTKENFIKSSPSAKKCVHLKVPISENCGEQTNSVSSVLNAHVLRTIPDLVRSNSCDFDNCHLSEIDIPHQNNANQQFPKLRSRCKRGAKNKNMKDEEESGKLPTTKTKPLDSEMSQSEMLKDDSNTDLKVVMRMFLVLGVKRNIVEDMVSPTWRFDKHT